MLSQRGVNPIEISYQLGDYSWDSENLLRRFTSKSGMVTEYSYDDRDLRQSKDNGEDPYKCKRSQ